MSIENTFDEVFTLCKNNQSKSTGLNLMRSLIKDERFQKHFISNINKFLGSSATKINGLQLLTHFIEEIPGELICQEGPYWIKCCLTNYQHGQYKELRLILLCKIIELSEEHLDLSKKLTSEYLNPILEISLSDEADITVKKAAVECLVSCLKCYGTYCKHYKIRIENYMLTFLESSASQLIKESAIGFLHCQKIPVGYNSVSCNDPVRKLCVTFQHCFDKICEQCIEIERFEGDGIEPFNISDPPLHYNFYLKVQYWTQVLMNILQWFIEFLHEGNFAINTEIFTLFEHVLCIHKCSNNESIEAKDLSYSFISIQTKVMEVLNLLLVSLKSNIFSFYPIVSKIQRDLIKNKRCECYLNCSLFQEYLYQVCGNMAIFGHGLEKSLQNTLVSQIIKNNTPTSTEVRVQINTNMVGKSSKTKQNLIIDKMDGKYRRLDKKWTKSKLKISESSLQGLLIILKHDTFEVGLLDKIAIFAIENILRLQRGIIREPLNNTHCQQLLFEIMCCLLEHENQSICTKYGSVLHSIVVNGCKNEDINILSTCKQGLSNMERIFETNCSMNNGNFEFSVPSGNTEYLENEEDMENVLLRANIETQATNEDVLQEMEVVPQPIEDVIEKMEEVPQKVCEEHQVLENVPQANENQEVVKNIIIHNNIELPHPILDNEVNLEHTNTENGSNEKEAHNLEVEHVAKKPKMELEENGADLFVEAFNEDYE